jgi:hypothetical protein
MALRFLSQIRHGRGVNETGMGIFRTTVYEHWEVRQPLFVEEHVEGCHLGRE